MSLTLVLSAASTLGVFSFFEPCTIATHTIFSVHSHRHSRRVCCKDLLMLWLSRSLCIIGLLVLAVALTKPPIWGKLPSALMLAAIATVYLLSRIMYIPVPHLELHKLLPTRTPIPRAIKLGLTLPACTLPLLAVIVALTITLDSLSGAVAAGLMFSSLFTLPTVVTALSGLNGGGRRLLSLSAQATPYLTALLLYSGAAYFFISK